MANFTPPFANTGEKRFPTSTEKSLGHACGPADRQLFNLLQHRLEAEIGHVIEYAGLVPTDDRYTQLREAIEQLIAAATGSGDTTDYLLMSQARSRLPIHPEIMNIDNRIICTQPAAGSVRMPGGVDFLHRGIYPVTTVQTDFATDPSTTYHLRWDKTNGFRLRRLTDAAYNPTSLSEANSLFDSTYDDMLIARMTTSSSNIATITNLRNAVRLEKFEVKTGPGIIFNAGVPMDGVVYAAQFSIDWGRTPMVSIHSVCGQTKGNFMSGYMNRVAITTQNRYTVNTQTTGDWEWPMTNATHGPWGETTLSAWRY
jgi:hypothetical protein